MKPDISSLQLALTNPGGDGHDSDNDTAGSPSTVAVSDTGAASSSDSEESDSGSEASSVSIGGASASELQSLPDGSVANGVVAAIEAGVARAAVPQKMANSPSVC